MKDTLSTQLCDRELRDSAVRSPRYRQLYSDRRLVDELDIVNELEGHSGCVNALSWSKSGRLLASGSDDQHLNIHEYQPADASSQFKFTTTVATGHTQNIFSVKFMPWSNDGTVVTCAGDGEVRIFDLEYAGQATPASRASNMATNGRRARRNNVYEGVKYLSDGDTNCRVYRSHGDRVKRIVTESSPHLFLTCSEDGEVRQWDLRQPSSAYPAPRGGQLSSSSSSDDSVPPPLISYKRYQLDLNTISCSPSQPHYIALGGAHLHAFLHDRRMTGRDKLREMGKTLSPSSAMSSEEEDLMTQATQCVRKFAPKGQQKMRRTENGHITALKISDARPNEMIASWSGNHIYSFDLIGAQEEADTLGPLNGSQSVRVRTSGERKRKRKANGSEASLTAAARGQSKPRTGEPSGNASLRIRYQNGQSEDVPLRGEADAGEPITEKERTAHHLAKATVRIRPPFFGSSDFSDTLGRATSVLRQMDELISDWRFPMDPSPEMVVMQQTLRSNRESARRFVQAAGTLCRAFGGTARTVSGSSAVERSFLEIETRTTDLPLPREEQFGYDFVKAVLLWLESGVGRLIEDFTRPSSMSATAKAAKRLPIPESDAGVEAVDEYLIPHLMQLASEKPVTDVTSNRFETDERRQLFSSEKAAVHAFAAAVRMPFADLSAAVAVTGSGEQIHAQDRQAAKNYWGLRAARGVLLNAAESVDFSFVSRAFGGSGRVVREFAELEEGDDLGLSEDEEDEAVQNVQMLDADGVTMDGANAEDVAAALQEHRERERSATAQTEDTEMTDTLATDESRLLASDAQFEMEALGRAAVADDDEGEDEDAEADSSEEEDDEAGSDTSSASEEDGVPNTGASRFLLSSAYERRRQRDKVGLGVPCTAATRSFRGHCNVKTVKDVNYFGPNDDFVVSGSDDGNLFIWDAHTGALVNVLEGDGEVVNVVQGHPYETMLAVSGIDHTVKIFSPDGRARTAARLGRGVSAQDPSSFSSLSWPSRAGRRNMARRRPTATAATTSEPAMPRRESESEGAGREDEEEDESFVAPNGLASRQRMADAAAIMRQNDVERQGGNSDAFLTRGMLAEIARRIRAHRAAAGGEEEEETAEGLPARVVLGDDCVVQ